jgi:hypothetical protein
MVTAAKKVKSKSASDIDRSPRLLPKVEKPVPQNGTKKSKTGGRVVKTLEQKMAEGEMASKIAGWHDDTTLDEELSAIYLGVSKKALEEMRLAEKAKNDDSARLDVIKYIPKGAIGQNQPVHYKLGKLREYQKQNTFSSSFQAAIAAGMAGWCTVHQPFFAELEKRRRATTLIAASWDLGLNGREGFFERLVKKEIRIVWMTSQEAATVGWVNLKSHKAFAKAGMEMLGHELQAIEAAIEGTEISEVVIKHPIEVRDPLRD